jgi:hypothetical protein
MTGFNVTFMRKKILQNKKNVNLESGSILVGRTARVDVTLSNYFADQFILSKSPLSCYL